MPDYPDRRHLYKSLNPQDFAPGTPKFNNPKKYDSVVYSRPAKRASPPRDAFRVTTAPKPPEPPPPPPQPYVEPIPDSREITSIYEDIYEDKYEDKKENNE